MPSQTMTLANKITLARILLAPLFVITLVSKDGAAWSLPLFIFLALTDVLDGALARRMNQKTALGTFLDPVADKLLLGGTFLILSLQGRIPVWSFVVVFSRDLLILMGWNLIYILTRTSTIQPRWLGKATTASQMIAVIVFLSPPLAAAGYGVLIAMVVLTAASTVDYVWVGGQKLAQLG